MHHETDCDTMTIQEYAEWLAGEESPEEIPMEEPVDALEWAVAGLES